ncbi:MAG: DinB family protein [Bacteroidia bacterium]|nr:DinB family protein [Bacteroidia bacterium]
MTQDTLLPQLMARYQAFAALMVACDDQAFRYAPPGKWTAGQHLAHLVRSVALLPLAYRLPGFVLRALNGRPNRPSRTYEALVARYQARLADGGRARGFFVPPPVRVEDRQALVHRLTQAVGQLCQAAAGYTDAQWDEYLLPHPLLGKLTLREMLYFTLYHAGHHEALVRQHNLPAT